MLTAEPPRLDADIAFLEVQQERAEAIRYINAKEERDSALLIVYEAILDIWTENVSETTTPTAKAVRGWIAKYPPEEIEKAIITMANSKQYSNGRLRGDGYVRYVWGILRNSAEER